MPPVKKQHRQRRRHFIREWRKHIGLTQEQVAEIVGQTATTVGRIEKNDIPYNQDFLEQVADAFGCSVSDLLNADPEKKKRAEAQAARFNDFNPEEQADAIKYLEYQRSKKGSG